ncbi:hypothetical protein GCM10011321_03860 [Youhaiella tibetensis]|uniref:Uncharacterized protein n=1 Tax=Paradevosia tibetensis TaxID=1447062 RepID=A0A5B9DQF2_9HYPH|nr:hypothetical protein [Youhaiella tibetensis]AKR56359.1 hypothetical protein XM25_11235 [Devosia sp. H5989]QEE21413.1 hypothetical protein FNA67_15000 [Youhaiella tibetensis]GGF15260.1 hypothetical protein GCM10011321_03860 [Youhaiella tibetensis]
MTFKYRLAVPIVGPHKIKRFRSWIGDALPDLDYNLPLQTPIATSSMTVRLRSMSDRQRLEAALPPLVP